MLSDVVIGIDADTRQLAWAAFDQRKSVWSVKEIPRSTKTGDFFAAYERELLVLMRWAQGQGAVVYLEGTYLEVSKREAAARANVRSFGALCEVRGEIRYEARRHGVPVIVVSASEWHSRILGITSGREALKADARRRAERDTGLTEMTEHMCDAVCIAQFGRGEE